tara:strand:- start:125 stop:742 length:618 start_codon:yes stop_codon:yes gene_type:complete
MRCIYCSKCPREGLIQDSDGTHICERCWKKTLKIEKIKQQKEKERLLKFKNGCSKGMVYLIQPEIYYGTNCYKVGMSNKENIDRVKSYKNDSRILCVYNCKNPHKMEKNIINRFTDCFDIVKGKEYFYIDLEEQEIQNMFMETIQDTLEKDCESNGFKNDTFCLDCDKYIGIQGGITCRGLCTDCFKEYELLKKENIEKLKLITS